MELISRHAWVTRYLFPKGAESRHNQYVLHFEKSAGVEELVNEFADLLKDFVEEIGGQWHSPDILEKGRFLIEGPKGFAIVEVAPAYTEEEVNQMGFEPQLDLSVWEKMFGADSPPEPTREKDEAT